MHPPNRPLLLALIGLALASRLAWALWIHPPGDFVFRDMEGYLYSARHVLEHGFTAHRYLAFQAWGTHALLAALFALFGAEALVAAAVLWACLGAAAVPIVYLLACRVCSRPWVPAVVGIAALLWYPNIANTGVFLAEAPLLGCLTAAVWRLVVLLEEGRGALVCGLLCATCFALRPETAVFLLLAFVLWLVVRRDHGAAKWRHIGLVSAPLAVTLAFSLVRFHHHTGRWGGIAESAAINFTLARCQHPRLQGYRSPEEFARDPSLKAGRSVGVASYAQRLADKVPERLLGLRPAFGRTPTQYELDGPSGPVPIRISARGMSIQYVGHHADPEIHAAIARACVARTGLLGQLRMSLSNLAGLWFFNAQWPDNSDRGERFRPWSDAFVTIFQWLIWLPSTFGALWAVRNARQRPRLAVCALPLIAIVVVAAIWFGEIRLRTPYDPLALLLAGEVYGRLTALRRSSLRQRDRTPDE